MARAVQDQLAGRQAMRSTTAQEESTVAMKVAMGVALRVRAMHCENPLHQPEKLLHVEVRYRGENATPNMGDHDVAAHRASLNNITRRKTERYEGYIISHD